MYELLIARLIRAATARGYSQDNPVLLTIDGDGNRVNVIVSAVEPFEVRAPLNLLWIQPNGTLLRRQSRESSGVFTQTWAAVSDFYSTQHWDEPIPQDQTAQEHYRVVGNVHNLEASDINAMSSTGGTLTGPLILRTELEAPYAANEAVPRSLVVRLIQPVQNIAASAFQQLNSIRGQMNSLIRRMVAVELAVTSIEGVQAYSYSHRHISLMETNWTVEHFLDAEMISVYVVKEDGTYVICERVVQINKNKCVIVFAKPVSGKAVILKVA